MDDDRFRPERDAHRGEDIPAGGRSRSRSRSRSRERRRPDRGERRGGREADREQGELRSERPDRSAPERGEWPPPPREERARSPRSRSRSRSRSRERRIPPPRDRERRARDQEGGQTHSSNSGQALPSYSNVGGGSSGKVLPPSSSLMLRNLSSTVDEAALMASLVHRFPPPGFSPPFELRVIRERGEGGPNTGQSKGYAFAEFSSTAEATALLEASRTAKWMLEGRQVGVAFGAPKIVRGGGGRDRGDRDRGGDLGDRDHHRDSYARDSYPQQAAAMPVEPPWDCPRCATTNQPHAVQCAMCNIARSIVAHGEAATAAMSVRGGHQPHLLQQQQQPLLQLSGHMPAAVPPHEEEEQLVAAISRSKVLFLSGLSPSTTADSVRSKFVPYGALLDVLLPLADDAVATPLGSAFVRFEGEHEAAEVLSRLTTASAAGEPCLIDERPVTVVMASAEHFALALRHRLTSWAAQSVVEAKARFGSAVAAAGSQALAAAGGRHPGDVDWTRVVADQAEVYAEALKPAPATIPSRPLGLAASFLFDMASGYWHDAASGYYFAPHTQLYYHANSGYSRWDATTGAYVPTDEHGQPVQQANQAVSLVAAQYLAMKAAQEFEKHQAAAAAAAAASAAAAPASVAVSFSIKPTGSAAALASRKVQPVAAAPVDPAAATPTTAAPPVAAALPAPNPFLDLTRLACLLCQRQLKSLDQLLKHESHSQLHKDNLAKYHERMAQQQQQLPPLESATAPAAPAVVAVAPTPVPAAAVPTLTSVPAPAPASAAASDYLRQMAQFRDLERNDGTAHRPLMK